MDFSDENDMTTQRNYEELDMTAADKENETLQDYENVTGKRKDKHYSNVNTGNVYEGLQKRGEEQLYDNQNRGSSSECSALNSDSLYQPLKNEDQIGTKAYSEYSDLKEERLYQPIKEEHIELNVYSDIKAPTEYYNVQEGNYNTDEKKKWSFFLRFSRRQKIFLLVMLCALLVLIILVVTVTVSTQTEKAELVGKTYLTSAKTTQVPTKSPTTVTSPTDQPWLTGDASAVEDTTPFYDQTTTDMDPTTTTLI